MAISFSTSNLNVALAVPAFTISMFPVIVATLPAPEKVSVIPSSKVCAALRTTVPAPVALAPLFTVGAAKAGLIPIPLTVLTVLSIPSRAVRATLVLAEEAEVVVVVIGVKAILRSVNFI